MHRSYSLKCGPADMLSLLTLTHYFFHQPFSYVLPGAGLSGYPTLLLSGMLWHLCSVGNCCLVVLNLVLVDIRRSRVWGRSGSVTYSFTIGMWVGLLSFMV
jgi:hypothetical protein